MRELPLLSLLNRRRMSGMRYSGDAHTDLHQRQEDYQDIHGNLQPWEDSGVTQLCCHASHDSTLAA